MDGSTNGAAQLPVTEALRTRSRRHHQVRKTPHSESESLPPSHLSRSRTSTSFAAVGRLQHFSTSGSGNSRFQQPNRVDPRGRAQVRIPLRDRQVLMAHQFLHRPHGRTPHDQVRAERVTQDAHAGRHVRAVCRITNPRPAALPSDRLSVVKAQHA